MMKIDAAAATIKRSIDRGTDRGVREPRGEERIPTGFDDAANVEPRGSDQADSRYREVEPENPGRTCGRCRAAISRCVHVTRV